MASNQLTDKVRLDIKESIDHLLGRVLPFMPCPVVKFHDINQLDMSILTPEVKEALLTLQRSTIAPVLETIRWTRIQFQIPVSALEPIVQFTATGEHYFFWHRRCRMNEEYIKIRPGITRSILGKELAAEFFTWMTRATEFTKDAELALTTVKEIVTMAKTPGQLKRMMPDLVDYVPPSYRAALRNQQRSSSVPFEWATYPREKLHAASTTLAKCTLLPSQKEFKWSERMVTHTWLADPPDTAQLQQT